MLRYITGFKYEFSRKEFLEKTGSAVAAVMLSSVISKAGMFPTFRWPLRVQSMER
jgi:hypothetical protein